MDFNSMVYSKYLSAMYWAGLKPSKSTKRCPALAIVIFKFFLNPVWILPIRVALFGAGLIWLTYHFLPESLIGNSIVIFLLVVGVELQIVGLFAEYNRILTAWVNGTSKLTYLYDLLKRDYSYTPIVRRLLVELVLLTIFLPPVVLHISYTFFKYVPNSILVAVVVILGSIVFFNLVKGISHLLQKSELLCPQIGSTEEPTE